MLSWRSTPLVPLLTFFALTLCLPLITPPARTAAPPVLVTQLADEPQSYDQQSTPLAGGDGEVWSVALSPDGKTLAAGTGGPRQRANSAGALVLWDVAQGKPRAVLPTARAVRWVCYSPDGKHLATGEFDETARLRDPATGEVRHTLSGHTVGVGPVLFTHDNKKLVTGGLDNKIKVWEVASGKEIRTLEGHVSSVLGLCLARDGKTLYSVSRQGVAKVFDLEAGKELHSWQMAAGGECLTLSRDDKTLVSGHPDGSVRFWDVQTRRQTSSVTVHVGLVTMTVLSPDGKTLATAGQDRSVRLWDAKSGSTNEVLSGHTSTVYGLAFDKDGGTLVSGSWDFRVKLWDVKERKERRQLLLPQFSEEMRFSLTGLACSPNGRLVAACGESKAIKLIETPSGRIRLLEGHEDVVARVAFAPDNRTLASAGFDEKVILWDVQTGKIERTLKGHENWVYAVAFSPDGRTVASAGYDRSVRLWDRHSGKALDVIKKSKGSVRAVAFSRDGTRLAFAGADKVVRVWSLKGRDVTHELRGHDDAVRAVAFSPDGRFLASGGEDNVARLWDLTQSKEVSKHEFGESVRDVCFSPRGTSLACVSDDRSLRIFDPTTGALRNNSFGHAEGVTALAYSPDAGTLYTASTDRLVRTWRGAVPLGTPRLAYRAHAAQTWVALLTADGEQLITAGADNTVQVRKAKTDLVALQAPTGQTSSSAYSPDGKWLAVACSDTTVKVYDRRSGVLAARLPHNQAVWSVAFSPDSTQLAAGTGRYNEKGEPGELKIWDTQEWSESFSLVGHRSIITGLAYTPDGKTLAGCDWDGGVILWDLEKGNQRAALKGFARGTTARGLAMRKDGKALAVAGFDGTVRLWNPETAKEIATLKTPEAVAHSVSFAPDGTLAVACNPIGNADQPLWSGKGPGLVVLFDVEQKKEIRRLEWKGGKALAVAFSPDGKTLAVGSVLTNHAAVTLWDPTTGKRITELRGSRQFVASLAFSPKGRFLAGAGGSQTFPDGLSQWDVSIERGCKVLRGHTGSVNCAALSKDGKVLATGSSDKTIRLWSTTDWTLKGTMSGHEGMVRCLAFAPSGSTLASACDDGTVRLWDVATAKEKKVLTKYAIGAKAVAYSPDGSLLATSCSQDGTPQGGSVRVFETATDKERPGAEWANRAALSLAFSPDGRWLATGSPGFPSLFVYEVKTGRTARTVQASSVRHLAFSPDGTTLATGHGTGGRRGDGSIQLWDASRWTERGFLRGHASLCLAVAFSRDGKTLTSASTDGTARVWEVPAMVRGKK